MTKMKCISIKRILFYITICITLSTNAQKLAFPTAVGYGRNAGAEQPERSIYYVTNLNDAGEGSLRDALSEGNRYILFNVSGTIILHTEIRVYGDNIYIAGQTAFRNGGEGITVRNDGINPKGLLYFYGDHIIMRYLRLRIGPGGVSSDGDNVNLFGSHWIMDHCSVSWGTDENFSSSSGSNGTIQHTISSEGLYFSSHTYSRVPTDSTYQNGHSKGGIFGYKGVYAGNLTFYRNLFAHNDGRNPQLSPTNRVEIVNNVLYNNRSFNIQLNALEKYDEHNEVMETNVVKNLMISGKDTSPNRGLIYIVESDLDQLYVQGNIGSHRTSDTDPEWRGIWNFPYNKNKEEDPTLVFPETGRSLVPFETPLQPQYATLPKADNALRDLVLNTVGANLNPDTVDERVLSDVTRSQAILDTVGLKSIIELPGYDPTKNDIKTHYYEIINDPKEVGGWPILHAMESVPTDSDQDGMEDTWEIATYGSLTTDTHDDSNANGWENIEEYLNSLTGIDVVSNTSGTSSCITNIYDYNDPIHPSNETSTLGTHWFSAAGNASLQVDTNASTGAHALVCTANASNYSKWGVTVNNLVPGQRYKATFNAKSSNAAGTSYGNALVTNQNNTYRAAIKSSYYTTYTLYFTPTIDTDVLYFYPTLATEIGQQLWIDTMTITSEPLHTYIGRDATDPIEENESIGPHWEAGAGNATIETTEKNENTSAGEYAVLITAQAKNWSRWNLTVNHLVPGVQYQLLFDAKSSNAAGTSHGTAFVKNNNNTATDYIDNESYTLYHLTFTPASTTETFHFFPTLGTEIGQQLWVDNIRIVAMTSNVYQECDAAHPVHERNAIGNHWSTAAGNATMTVTDDASIGDSSLLLTAQAVDHSKWQLALTDLIPNTVYTLTFDAKSSNAAGTYHGNSLVTNQNNTNRVHIHSSDYTSYTLSFTPTSATEMLYFYPTLATEIGQQLWIDNIVITTPSQVLQPSDTIDLQHPDTTNAPVLAYPNPASTSLTVSYEMATEGTIDIQLFGISGMPYFSNQQYRKQGQHTQQIDVSTLPNTTAILQVTIHGNTYSQLIQIEH